VTPADLVVDALAVARLTRLVTTDEVPFGPARDLLLDAAPDSKAATLVSCDWCAGMWCAAAVAFARWRWPRAWPVLARVLAGSQVAGMAGTWVDR
jgi:hypothetical protein